MTPRRIGKSWLVEYASMGELVSSLDVGKLIANKPHLASNSTDHGGCGLKEAVKLATEGWPEGVAKLEEIGVAHKFTDKSSVNMFEVVNDYAGCMVDLDRYLTQQPEVMLDFRPAVSDKLVTICINGTTNWDASTNSIYYRGLRLMQLIDSLESKGYRTEVFLEFCGRSWGSTKTPHHVIRLQLKRFQDYYDTDLMTFALTHPAMLRRLFFAVCFQNQWDGKDYLGGSLGSAADVPPETREFPADIDLPAMASYTTRTEKDIDAQLDKHFGPYLDTKETDTV